VFTLPALGTKRQNAYNYTAILTPFPSFCDGDYMI